jgi:hypothetical protein
MAEPGTEQDDRATRRRARAQAARRQLRRVHRISVWTMRIALILGVTAAIAVAMLLGQRLHASDTLRAQLETRIEQNLGGLQIGFGDVQFVLAEGWLPRLRLVDVDLSDADGRPILHLADARISLALPALLRGRIQPRRIELSGAMATLRRARDGTVELSFGDAVRPAGQAAGIAQLIETWDQRLTTPQLALLNAVAMENLTLRFEDLAQGRAWTLDGGTVRLGRSDGDLRLSAAFSLLSGRDYASTLEMNYRSRIGEAEAEFGVSVQDIPAEDIGAQSVALAWLKVLQAPISGSLRGGIDGDGRLGPLSATLQIGAGAVQPHAAARPIPFDGARSYFSYDPVDRLLRFNELSVASTWGSVTAEGQAQLNGDDDRRLTDMVGQFTLSGLRVNPPGQYPQPLDLEAAGLDFRLALDPFRLTLGRLTITDQGDVIRASGELGAGEQGWRLALEGQVDSLTPDRLKTLWPAALAPKPRAWVEANLTGGHIEDADFALRLVPGQKPDIYLDFDFADAGIRFLKSMPPIDGASGHATLVERRFTLTATAGRVMAEEGGAVEVAGTSFIVPDTGIRVETPAVVEMQGSGPVTAVMSLLNRPPLQVLKGTPLPVNMASGTLTAAGRLELPLKKGATLDDVVLRAEGRISSAQSAVLVPDHLAAAPELAVAVDNGQVVLSGAVSIDGVPAQVTWRQPIGRDVSRTSRLEGEIELSPDLIRTFAIGLPPGSVSGKGQGRFTLDFAPGKAPELALTSDLRGVGLALPELGWSKPAAAAGRLQIMARLGDATTVERLEIEAAGLKASGRVVNRPGGGLERAVFSSVQVGGWLDATVEMIGHGARPPDIRILDGTLDFRRARFGSGSGGGGALQVSLARLQVTDSIALNGFRGEFGTAGGFNGKFSARLNGGTAVEGTVVPRDGRSAVRVTSSDAGGVFRDAGILSHARGGAFAMTLLPTQGEGRFDGSLNVTNTRIKDAPAMAALLNAVSVVGLLNELAGDGIPFSDVEARFRLDPARLTLLEGSAVGPSIGLSMDGVFDVASGNLGMRGVISPVYILNSVGSVLTRKGEGLFGFSYTLTGPAASPRVQVNPLSGLAPGMFREVFRGAAPPAVDDAATTIEPQRKLGRGSDR